MKYDFLLLEHLYTVENHYKDLGILAHLLKKVGFKVAIVDVFKEAELCKVGDIPHLSLDIDWTTFPNHPFGISDSVYAFFRKQELVAL